MPFPTAGAVDINAGPGSTVAIPTDQQWDTDVSTRAIRLSPKAGAGRLESGVRSVPSPRAQTPA